MGSYWYAQGMIRDHWKDYKIGKYNVRDTQEARRKQKKNIKYVIVGNKWDLSPDEDSDDAEGSSSDEDEKKKKSKENKNSKWVTETELNNFGAKWDVGDVYFVSALNGTNIQEMFDTLSKQMLKDWKDYYSEKDDDQPEPSDTLNDTGTKISASNDKTSCCIIG